MPSTFSVCGSLLLHFVGFMIGLQLQLIIWLHSYAIPQEGVGNIFFERQNKMQLLNQNLTFFRPKKVIIVSGPIFFIVTASLGWKHAFGNSETE